MRFALFVVTALAVAMPLPAHADAPCAAPAAATLADRPGTGRSPATGGAACVVPPGELLIESGLRRQVTSGPDGAAGVLASGPLTVLRYGLAPRLEVVFAPPVPQSRSARGPSPFPAARGTSDATLGAKLMLIDRAAVQLSFGASYTPPTGSTAFTAGAPTFTVGLNSSFALSPALTLTIDEAVQTATGAFPDGTTRVYAVHAPSYAIALAVGPHDTLLLQDALLSRQGPLLPAGSRLALALQHAIGTRLALDVDLERNAAPLNGAQHAVGAGLVWVLVPARR
jgi:Putative MetA-pathway of phenol degradation